MSKKRLKIGAYVSGWQWCFIEEDDVDPETWAALTGADKDARDREVYDLIGEDDLTALNSYFDKSGADSPYVEESPDA